MTTADELINKAHHFYALALGALNPSTKRRLDRLGDDYLRQAHELKRELIFTEATLLKSHASLEVGGWK
jgi:cellobiose-specific phosphotransferase system component IIA